MGNSGKIFGVTSSFIALDAGIRPLLAGAVHVIFGSYSPLIIAGNTASLLAALLLVGLGPYPVWQAPTKTQVAG